MADADAQLATIWNTMSPAVERQIQTTGTFSTSAAVLRGDNTVEAVVPDPSSSIAQNFRGYLRAVAAAGQHAAIGMASQVEANVPEAQGPVVGILYQFDNAEGVSQATFLPYQVDAAGVIQFGELHGQEGAHDLFPAR